MLKKTGANPELANMNKKRMVVSSEPEDGTKIQMGITKEITGCNESLLVVFIVLIH